ncbi:unnamed protein product [Mytilus edulis]|uniref:Uncharacterized protein n=1 Tax=Mytilus edulis TaxID=6550 RepID=A0A8S3TT38_MYTED|nr:unnamed protein product [Mytilus edulis]
MTVPSCPKLKGGLKCSSDVQVQCGSLFPGHHQDCPVADARGGWLQCLDLTETLPGSVPCQERDYGIHRDNVWVQNGCQGNFYTCYIPVSPPGPINERTLECSTKKDQSYTQCKIDGAYLVDKVNMKIQFQENKTCTEGINYGIVADSIFVKDGCSGIFTVDFFPDSVAPPPVQRSSTTSTTSTTHKPSTTTTTLRTTTPHKSPSISSTTIKSTTNHTSIINPPTSSDSSGSIIVLTAAAVLGVFLVILIATLAILWFSRRYRCTKRYLERKSDGSGTLEGPSVGKLLPLKFNKGNIYEEISTHEEVPSAPPVYERQPFIGHEFTGHECSLEPNNNPKNPLGENYFILDPKYRDCRTLPRNMNHPVNFEPDLFHSIPSDDRPCQIHHPVARMGSFGNHSGHGHEPVIRMGTFNPKIHQYPLTLGPCMDPHMMHTKQNTLPVLNGKSMRISDSDVDEDGYQKIGTFGPQQKHFQNIPTSFQNAPPHFTNVPPSFANVSHFQPVLSEQCQNTDSNPLIFDTSSC